MQCVDMYFRRKCYLFHAAKLQLFFEISKFCRISPIVYGEIKRYRMRHIGIQYQHSAHKAASFIGISSVMVR